MSEIFSEGLQRLYHVRKNLHWDDYDAPFVDGRAHIYAAAVHKKCFSLYNGFWFHDGPSWQLQD